MLPHSFEVVTNRAFLENDLFAIAVGQWPEVIFEIGHEHRNIGLINLRAFFDHGIDDLNLAAVLGFLRGTRRGRPEGYLFHLVYRMGIALGKLLPPGLKKLSG